MYLNVLFDRFRCFWYPKTSFSWRFNLRSFYKVVSNFILVLLTWRSKCSHWQSLRYEAAFISNMWQIGTCNWTNLADCHVIQLWQSILLLSSLAICLFIWWLFKITLILRRQLLQWRFFVYNRFIINRR